jgi:ESS family glutamate:Na+ symporter
VLTLDLVQTLAFGGLVLFAGYGIRRLLPALTRYNIPAPVVGGLIVAVAITIARQWDATLITFPSETSARLQLPLQIAFFTTVGFAASLSLLRVGGPQVAIFFAFSTVVAIAQNVLGLTLAKQLGQHPLMGVLAGSVTLTGGPATGITFAPQFEKAGVLGAEPLAVAAAMVGIVGGGLIGGPIGTYLIDRDRLATPGEAQSRGAQATTPDVAAHVVEDMLPNPIAATPAGEDVEAYGLLKALVIILVAMWLGGWVSTLIQTYVYFPGFIPGIGGKPLTLPAYIGAMLVAAVIRNIDDVTGWFGLSQKVLDDIGSVALSLFLVIALMTLRLWQLAALAVPLAVILVCQLALVAAVAAFLVHRLMGRDYEAAVMSSGFVGFMLGTTANAMANMEALAQRFRPAPRAFLVVPMVGAFFIDFTNAIIITVFLNFWA